jgi:hypothetical protein
MYIIYCAHGFSGVVLIIVPVDYPISLREPLNRPIRWDLHFDDGVCPPDFLLIILYGCERTQDSRYGGI